MTNNKNLVETKNNQVLTTSLKVAEKFGKEQLTSGTKKPIEETIISREEINENFSFEWLPKQDYDNLVLGKYCNCCAHVDGAHIMK